MSEAATRADGVEATHRRSQLLLEGSAALTDARRELAHAMAAGDDDTVHRLGAAVHAYLRRLSIMLEEHLSVCSASALLYEPQRAKLHAVHTAVRGQAADGSADPGMRSSFSLLSAAAVSKNEVVVVEPAQRSRRASVGSKAVHAAALNGQSALAVPIMMETGEVAGALQLVGRIGNDGLGHDAHAGKALAFEAEDLQAVKAFAAQASCLLDLACAYAGVEHPCELLPRTSTRRTSLSMA